MHKVPDYNLYPPEDPRESQKEAFSDECQKAFESGSIAENWNAFEEAVRHLYQSNMSTEDENGQEYTDFNVYILNEIIEYIRVNVENMDFGK